MIVERANQEVMGHLRALLFDSRVHDKWSFEQLPLVQRITNTVEKTSTGVTPAELILSHSIRLTSHIMSPIKGSVDSSDTSLSDRMVQLQSDMQKEIDTQAHLLKKVTREHDEARSEANESQQSAKNLFNEQKRLESQNDRGAC